MTAALPQELPIAYHEDDQTIEDIAAQQGCSPALVYKLIARTSDALLPERHGPRSSPRVPAATTSPTLKAPVLAGVDLVALVSVLTVRHVPIRGIREVSAALGQRVPDNSILVAWVREAGPKEIDRELVESGLRSDFLAGPWGAAAGITRNAREPPAGARSAAERHTITALELRSGRLTV